MVFAPESFDAPEQAVVTVPLAGLTPSSLASRLRRGGIVVVPDWFKDEEVLKLAASAAAPDYALLPHADRKAKPRDTLQPLTEKSFPKHVLRHFFPGRLKDAQKLQAAILPYDRKLHALIGQVFPGKILNVDYAWRLATCVDQGLHFDFYTGNPHPEAFHLRAFLNLDPEPRKWNVGPTSFAYAAEKGVLPLAEEDANGFNARLTKLSEAERPAHLRTKFPTGALWFADTQLRGHEVVWGRRLVSYTFSMAPEDGSPAQELAYANRFAAFKKAKLGGAKP